MAPYLLLGFAMAGLLRVFFNEEWVRRHLGRKGFRQIIKAVLIGIPIPLCSCGVIPVAAGIRRQGGQRGAVAAFTASTPQTGVDSIAATVGMLGWAFTIVRIVIAFINGLVAGLVVEKLDRDHDHSSADRSGFKSPDAKTTGDADKPEANPASLAARLASSLKFGLITLPGDLSVALVTGLLVAGAISALAPADLFASLPGGRFALYAAMTLISLPLYVCSTGSIPMAFTFLQAGMSPGAVLIFLIAGPASNTATVVALWSIIGGKATVGYILSIIATCWAVAVFIDYSGISLLVSQAVHHHHDMGVSLFQQACAGLLIALLVVGRIRKGK